MKKLMALIALVAMVTVSSVAYAQSSAVTVGATVGAATTLDVYCWNLSGVYSWVGPTDPSVSLVQPGDFTGDGTGAADDPADDYGLGTIPGTAVYTTDGGNPASSLTGEASNAFGYGDCKVDVSTSDLTWDIALTADAFDNAGVTADIDGMANAGLIGFDMTLDNGTAYAATDEEHGFYVVDETDTIGALVNPDDGTAFGITYTDATRTYDELSCGTGTEPCYHGLEDTVGQQLYIDTAAGLTSQEFVTRFGVGVDATTASDTYGMTATYTITI